MMSTGTTVRRRKAGRTRNTSGNSILTGAVRARSASPPGARHGPRQRAPAWRRQGTPSVSVRAKTATVRARSGSPAGRPWSASASRQGAPRSTAPHDLTEVIAASGPCRHADRLTERRLGGQARRRTGGEQIQQLRHIGASMRARRRARPVLGSVAARPRRPAAGSDGNRGDPAALAQSRRCGRHRSADSAGMQRHRRQPRRRAQSTTSSAPDSTANARELRDASPATMQRSRRGSNRPLDITRDVSQRNAKKPTGRHPRIHADSRACAVSERTSRVMLTRSRIVAGDLVEHGRQIAAAAAVELQRANDELDVRARPHVRPRAERLFQRDPRVELRHDPREVVAHRWRLPPSWRSGRLA